MMYMYVYVATLISKGMGTYIIGIEGNIHNRNRITFGLALL